MKRLKTNLILLTTILVVAIVTSCRDEFTEQDAITAAKEAATSDQLATEDALKLQAELEGKLTADEIKLRDSLARLGGLIHYTVAVVDAGNAAFSSGSGVNSGARIKGTEAVSGAVVSVAQNGVIASMTTGADGLAVFSNMRIGNVAVHVEVTDFTNVDFVADLTPLNNSAGNDFSSVNADLSSQTRNAATQIPVFPTTGANTATISGMVTYESDLTNSTPEFPATNVIAIIDSDFDFIDTYIAPAGSDANEDLAGRVIRISYAGASVSGAVDTATGAYSLTVPASASGLEYMIGTSDVITDQTLLMETFAADMQYVTGPQTFRTIYGEDIILTSTPPSSSIPNASAAWVTFSAPTGGTSGFGSDATASAVIGMSGTIAAINVTDAGKMYTQAPAVTITGDGINAAATAVLGAEGALVSVTVDNAGQGYSSASVALDFGGTQATLNTDLLAEIRTHPINVSGNPFDGDEFITLSTSGDDYATLPTPSFDNTGAGVGTGATGTIFGSVSDNSDVTAGGSLYVARYTVDDNGNAGDGIDNERLSGPPLVISAPDDATTSAATQADGHALIEGPITSITLGSDAADRNGNRYFMDDTSTPTLPVITVSPSKGATATATMSTTDGEVTGITILTGGNGYTFLPTVGLAGNALAQVNDMGVEAVNITDDGEQYQFADVATALFSAPDAGGVTATGTVNLESVVSSAWTSQAAGALTGYTALTVSWESDGSAGEGASIATIDGTIAGDNLTGFTVANGGAGFTSDPVWVLTTASDPDPNGIAGTIRGGFEINSITITGSGNNYTSSLDAAVTISDPFQADADAIALGVGAAPVNATGTSVLQVQGVSLLTNGNGYDYTSGTNTVTFSGGGGTTQATGEMQIATSISAVTVTAGGGYRPGEPGEVGVDNITVSVAHIFGDYFNGSNNIDENAVYEVTGFAYRATYDDNGAGYSAIATITVDDTDGGSGASIVSLLSDAGAYMTIDAGGSGYVVENDDDDFNGRNDLEVEVTFGSSTIGTLDYTDIDFTNGILSVSVATGGSGYTADPWVRVDENPGGSPDLRWEDITATASGGAVTAVTIVNVRLYDTYPGVSVETWREAGAVALQISTSGVIAVEVDVQGSGYDVPPDVIFGNPATGGSGAAATANVVDGRVESITVTSAGSGYISIPTVTLVVPNGPYVAQGKVSVNEKGVVSSIALWNLGLPASTAGSGYEVPPTVTISPSMTGVGSGATAVAELNSSGEVSDVVITNGGSGYFAMNTPNGSGVGWSIWPGSYSGIVVYANKDVVKDINMGTGLRNN